MTNEDQSTHTAQADSSRGDLSKTIDVSVEREPGETVRSIRVFGDVYRCNWWTSSGSDWMGVATGRISRSKLLRVVMRDERLVIDEMHGPK